MHLALFRNRYIPNCTKLSLVNGKRDSLLILFDILRIASVGPVSITRVTYGANLNHSSARRHLTHLQQRGLIDAIDQSSGRVYVITTRGTEVVREMERIIRNVATEKAVAQAYPGALMR